MISHEHRCIFIHIPKTAGTSIARKLGQFDTLRRNVQDHRALAEIEPLGPGNTAWMLVHGKATTLLRRTRNFLRGDRVDLTREQYDNYFKFAIVRDPWSRVFSWYRNILRDPVHQKRWGVRPDCPFEEFLREHLDQFALRSQLYWLRDHRGEMPLDFIGRYDHLQDDFASIYERLGLDDPQLPVLNSGDNADMHEAYSAVCREIVAQHYKEEIATFDFRFTGE